MSDDHDLTTCGGPECETCLDYSRHESVVTLETALLDLETSAEGAEDMWVEMDMRVDALDVRNVLDLLRGCDGVRRQ